MWTVGKPLRTAMCRPILYWVGVSSLDCPLHISPHFYIYIRVLYGERHILINKDQFRLFICVFFMIVSCV